MKNESIIEVIRDPDRELNNHIAQITGRKYVRKPSYYRNRQTGEEYISIAGSIAFPTLRTPGFAVFIAVLKEDKNTDLPTFKVIDEIENIDLEALLIACERCRHIWGYPNQLQTFYGDPMRFAQVLNGLNDRLKSKASAPGGIYLAQPIGLEDPNHTEVYLQTIRSLLRRSDQSGKRLILGDCQLLRSHIRNTPMEVQKIEDHPAVAALAYAVHSLAVIQPWLAFARHQQLRSTIDNWFDGTESWPSDDGGYDDFSTTLG